MDKEGHQVLDSKPQVAPLQRALGHTWSHWRLHQHKPSQELLQHISSSSHTTVPPQQSHPLCAALSSPEASDLFFWPCEPVQTEINTPLKRAGPSWYFILMAKKTQANNYEVPLVCRSFSNMFPT